MDKPTCNIGIRPLGRSADGPSPVVQKEIAALKAMVEDSKLLPPANCPANAKLHRQHIIKHGGESAKRFVQIFTELGLDF